MYRVGVVVVAAVVVVVVVVVVIVPAQQKATYAALPHGEDNPSGAHVLLCSNKCSGAFALEQSLVVDTRWDKKGLQG